MNLFDPRAPRNKKEASKPSRLNVIILVICFVVFVVFSFMQNANAAEGQAKKRGIKVSFATGLPPTPIDRVKSDQYAIYADLANQNAQSNISNFRYPTCTIIEVKTPTYVACQTNTRKLYNVQLFGLQELTKNVKGYTQAYTSAKSLLLDQYVYVQTLAVNSNGDPVSVMYTDEQNLNLALIQQGGAKAAKSNAADAVFTSVFSQAEQAAKTAKLGMWLANK